MIFELPDIFFGSHPKKEMASQPPQVRQYGFIKKLEKALSQADFSKIRSYLFRCNKPRCPYNLDARAKTPETMRFLGFFHAKIQVAN